MITLGIIGVVAAMTLPTLVQNYKEKQHITQVKKIYSILSQAHQMVTMEYGSIDTWDFEDTNTGEKDENENPVYDFSGPILVRNRFAKYMKHTNNTKPYTFRSLKSLDGRNYNSSGSGTIGTDNSIIYLADGSIIYFGWMNKGCKSAITSCGDILVYLPEKDAQFGVSAFNFYLTPKGIVPMSHPNDVYRPFSSYCDRKNSSGQSSNTQGRGCTAWVVYNGNMDYLHCDGLSWNGAKTCKELKK